MDLGDWGEKKRTNFKKEGWLKYVYVAWQYIFF